MQIYQSNLNIVRLFTDFVKMMLRSILIKVVKKIDGLKNEIN
jgi:hypothetical protein